MRYFIRKYANNRGSALFMVISTMTALMISCMAMYFSVISSRSTQYAIFNQQQAKQVSVGINDAVIAGMMDNQLEDLTKAMTNLAEGEKLTAGNNGFAEFGSEGGKENDQDLGAYTMEITRLPNETVNGVEKMVYDIVTKSSVNGANNVYHTIIYYEEDKKDEPPAPTQVFAATGYVPNDVFLDGGRFITDVFFDNEMTIVNAYGGKNMELTGDLSTGGSLTCNAYIHAGGKILNDKAGTPIADIIRSQTVAVRGTYTSTAAEPMKFAPVSPYGRSTVLIGGDCVLDGTNGFTNANVYVLGDLIITSNPDLENSNYFVDGDVRLEAKQTRWGTTAVWVKLKNVFCNGSVDNTKNTGGIQENSGLKAALVDGKGKTSKSWSEKAEEDGILPVTEMIDLLNEKTATNQYYKWVINDSDPKKDKYVKELDESKTTVKRKTLKFSQGETDPIPTIILKYDETGEKGCIIDDVVCDGGNQFNHLAIIIDTGEDEDNVYTIRVKPNRDFDGDNINETFSWYPYDTFSSATYMTILVKGRGSVVVDIPKGVTYQDLSFVKFMHYGWYLLSGAKPNTTKYSFGERASSKGDYWESSIIYDTTGIDNSSSDVNLERFIHSECKSGDGCDYSESDSTNKCPSCDKKMKAVECSVHGNLNEYCPTCKPEKKDKHEGECVNHVGRKEIDKYLESHDDLKSKMKGSDGEIIYPTTNIFLVSCDESANIRLSVMEDGTRIMQNSFFGYIYAPYMTFKAYGDNAGGGMVRLFGGMTVSDYIIDDSMSMIACWPEKMPTELMSEDCRKDKLQGITSKSWKISLKAH